MKRRSAQGLVSPAHIWTAFNQRSNNALKILQQVAKLKRGRKCKASFHLSLNSAKVLLLVDHSLPDALIVNIIRHERLDAETTIYVGGKKKR